MKKIYLLVSVLALVSFFGCEKEQDGSADSGTVNSLSFHATPSTKAIISNVFEGKMVWSSYDNIAAYSYDASNYLHGDFCTINPDDIEYVEATFNSSSTVDTWFGSAANATFYSFYPQLSAPAPAVSQDGKIAMNIPATQNGEFGRYQICWAKTDELSKESVEENGNVAFGFDPKTSVIRTRLTLDQTCEVDQLNIVKLKITLPEGIKAVGDCTLDIFTGAVTMAENGSSVITIDLEQNPVTVYKIEEANPTIDCALFPISLDAQNITFEIETEDDGIVTVTKEATQVLEAGGCYDVDLTFNLVVDTTPHNYYYGSTNCYVVMGNSVTVDVTRHEAGDDYLPVEAEVTTSREAKTAVLLWREKTLTSINVPETVTGNSFEITNITGNGNALVGIKDKRGNIVWSYHIWVPEIDPTAEADLLTYMNCSAEKDSYKVMPLNLGAVNKYVYSAEDDHDSAEIIRAKAKSMGYYYQWGRKDPLGRVQSCKYIAADNPAGAPALYAGRFTETVDAEGKDVDITKLTSKVSTALAGATEDRGRVMREWSVKNPTIVLYAESAENQNWACDIDNKLWGNEKTIYDPCPAGYIVAPNGLWNNFNTTAHPKNSSITFGGKNDSVRGYNFYYQGDGEGLTEFYATNGRGQVDGSGVYAPKNAEEQSYYWSSTPKDGDKQAHGFYFGSGSIGPGNSYDRENGGPIRCVKIE